MNQNAQSRQFAHDVDTATGRLSLIAERVEAIGRVIEVSSLPADGEPVPSVIGELLDMLAGQVTALRAVGADLTTAVQRGC
jgi:hypothetical protein